jgi:3-hydroxymyristoyl/3-hydroxydecanoyl-(acyl carrier protein) dehydratase
MADLPQITESVILPINITVSPYLQDHRFEGNAVFPAVEALQVLAQAVKEFAPLTDITAITEVRFDKFLLIPPDSKNIDALCSITPYENGDLTAVLQTKTRSKTAAFTRIKEHVTVHYPRIKPQVTSKPNNPSTFGNIECLEISPDQIYRELVPFGPAYQNITENLAIHKDGGLAKLRAPIINDPVEKSEQLGSPFVLDAAFHAACVWGQRYSGVVAFPVGVDTRIILKPTLPGETYIGRIIPVRTDSDLLVFDIFIGGEDNILFESAVGVHMRDVSAGRMKPPSWIIATDGKS